MAACELVIFDCDGTIMDTELLAADVEVSILAEYGAKISAAEFSLRFAGTSSEKVKEVMEFELNRNLPDDHIARVKARLNERLWREARAMTGVHAMLDMFDQPRCICSNADMKKLKIELTRGELWDRFRPFVYSAHELENNRRKPEPDIFLHAAREFNVAPGQCAVVEDSTAGVIGARAAGMRVIGFTGGSHTYQGHAEVLMEAGAETVVRRLTDVPAILSAFDAWNGAA